MEVSKVLFVRTGDNQSKSRTIKNTDLFIRTGDNQSKSRTIKNTDVFIRTGDRTNQRAEQ